MDNQYSKELIIKKMDIHTGELIALLNDLDARELGVLPLERIIIRNEKAEYVAVVVDITTNYIQKGTIGLYEDVFEAIDLTGINQIKVYRAPKPESINFIKDKMRAKTLSFEQIKAIVDDIKHNKLSKIELTGFMSGVYINGMDTNESYAMAKCIMDSGDKLDLGVSPIVDKHSIGGINGRATMLVVPIIAAGGLYIPKTSSRAITSPAGTADSMEVLTNVEFSIQEFKEIVLKTKGGIIWGGGISLAPVDDKMIKVEFPLSLDPKGQVVASVLAKKATVGAQKVVIDLPVGKDLKVKSVVDAEDLAGRFITVGKMLGMDVKALITNGSVPSGPAFGPALEARHTLSILEGKVFDNLAEKATEIAGKIFEMAGRSKTGEGVTLAKTILRDGSALNKMQEIIRLQGKKCDKAKDVPIGEYHEDILANTEGYIQDMSIKELTEVAKYSGCPYDKGAGLLLHVNPNESVKKGDLLFTIYADNKEKLQSARYYAQKVKPVSLENVILEEM